MFFDSFANKLAAKHVPKWCNFLTSVFQSPVVEPAQYPSEFETKMHFIWHIKCINLTKGSGNISFSKELMDIFKSIPQLQADKGETQAHKTKKTADNTENFFYFNTNP